MGQDGESFPASETQRDSFERTKEHAATNCEKVLEEIKAAGNEGLCVGEVAEELGWDQHWVSPRVWDLAHKFQPPLIKESDKPPRWNARSKRFQTVWVAT